MLKEELASVTSLGFMSEGSERLFSLNLSMFALVKSLICGLSFKDLVLISIRVTLGR